MAEPILVAWSGGKDSALALNEIQSNDEYEIKALLTTITADYARVSMHGFRTELLEGQANALGLDLETVFISKNCTIEEYDSRMREVLEKYLALGVKTVMFGDIFLEDVRRARENNLVQVGMNALFPLWKSDTKQLANRFIELGFKAVITCVDSTLLDGSFVGRDFDSEFISELPSSVDPCGENGEFHSFVYDGPNFKHQIKFTKGEIVLRDDRFYFSDLIA